MNPDLSVSQDDFVSILNTIQGQLTNCDDEQLMLEYEKVNNLLRKKHAVKLLVRYMQAAVVSHVKDKYSLSDAAALCTKSESQAYSEIKYYILLKDYPALLFIDLSFDKIKKNATKIRDMIEQNKYYKTTFKNKVNLTSTTTVEINIVYE